MKEIRYERMDCISIIILDEKGIFAEERWKIAGKGSKLDIDRSH